MALLPASPYSVRSPCLPLCFSGSVRSWRTVAVSSLPALCRLRWGSRFAALSSALFVLLCAMTGGAMLAACAELFALTLPIHYASALGMVVTLLLALILSVKDMRGLALIGAMLSALLPFFLLRLLRLPVGRRALSLSFRRIRLCAR